MITWLLAVKDDDILNRFSSQPAESIVVCLCVYDKEGIGKSDTKEPALMAAWFPSNFYAIRLYIFSFYSTKSRIACVII